MRKRSPALTANLEQGNLVQPISNQEGCFHINVGFRRSNEVFLNYLEENCQSEVIILFGSASLGEDLLESDIDLFLQCKDKKLNLKRYQKLLKRRINIFFEEKFNKLSEELKSNIINGIKLKGYLRIEWKKT